MSLPLPVRILVNLYYKIWRHVWYPLGMLWKRMFSIMVLIGFGYIVSLFLTSEENKPIPAPPIIAGPTLPGDDEDARQKPRENPSLIQGVKQHEDGNSRFSSDLVPAMKKEELKYYSEQFYSAMDNTPDFQAMNWQFFNINGSIVPTETFNNNLGQTCRRFDEVLKVHQTQQTISGIGCQQKGGGWCKLRTTSTPVCDLGRKGGLSDWWFDTNRDIGRFFTW